MSALYNEIDPAAAHILQRQIDDGVIAPGVVDTRSIKELTPDDLAGYTQVHLFAGGGLWSVAARLAGWPDDAPIWTASCPCRAAIAARPELPPTAASRPMKRLIAITTMIKAKDNFAWWPCEIECPDELPEGDDWTIDFCRAELQAKGMLRINRLDLDRLPNAERLVTARRPMLIGLPMIGHLAAMNATLIEQGRG